MTIDEYNKKLLELYKEEETTQQEISKKDKRKYKGLCITKESKEQYLKSYKKFQELLKQFKEEYGDKQ